MHIDVGVAGSGRKRGKGVGVDDGQDCRLIEFHIS
jgi:hypothetical protein